MARKNQYEIGIAGDTSGFEKAISNGLVDPLEEAEKAFDKLEDAAQDAKLDKQLDKAADSSDKLSGDLSDTRDALKKLGYAAKDAGDDAKKGLEGAGEGAETFKDEAKQSAREAAASFSDVTDILDLVQETAANALGGFGPAGVAAGIVAAAGIGLAVSAFQDAEKAAEELRQKANDYANDARDAGASTDSWLSSAQQVADRMRELQDIKDNGALRPWWEDDPDDLEKWVDGLKSMGRATSDVEKVLSSTDRGVKDYRDAVDESRKALVKQRNEMIKAASEGKKYSQSQIDSINDQIKGTVNVLDQLDKEIDLRKKSASASKTQQQAGVDSALARAQAEEDMADRVSSAQDAVVDSTLSAFDTMRSAAYDKATADDAAFDTNKWLNYVEQGRKLAEGYKTNLAAMKLSPEEWENFLALPEDARTNIAASYQTAGEEGQQRIRAALSDTGTAAGQEATVGFDDAFNPKADVTITADTSKAKADLDDVTAERTATIKTKLTGVKAVREDLTAVARKRTATVEVRLDTSAADKAMANWRRKQQNTPVTVPVKKTDGGWNG